MPWTRCPVRPHILSFTFPDSRRAVVSYWCKYVHEVLVNRLGGLSLPRKSVVRLTDHPNMTSAIYHGCKTTTQQQQLTPIPAPPQMLMLGGGGWGGGEAMALPIQTYKQAKHKISLNSNCIH